MSSETETSPRPRSTEQCSEDGGAQFVVHTSPSGKVGGAEPAERCATARGVETTAPAYRSQIGNRQPRKDRLSFTMDQLRELEKSFASKKYLCFTERAELADKIGVSEAQVKTWYQNRRTKWKKNYKLNDQITA